MNRIMKHSQDEVTLALMVLSKHFEKFAFAGLKTDGTETRMVKAADHTLYADLFADCAVMALKMKDKDAVQTLEDARAELLEAFLQAKKFLEGGAE